MFQGSPLLPMGNSLLPAERARSDPQMAQISADFLMVSTSLSAGRSKRYAARNPRPPMLPMPQRRPSQPTSHMARGALSLPEGAEIISRAAARLCERPRSAAKRTQAPAGPENHGSCAEERSRAPAGADGRFLTDRWRRSRGSLADRLFLGGPTGPGRQDQFFRERHPNL